jgi:23S rRNA (adenine2030-N6)-methyltransferase
LLSYRHAFHAGNFADILKHLVLTNTLEYVTRKEAPVFYLDTHAGAGLYRLHGAEAKATGEAKAGVLKLDFAELGRKAGVAGKEALQIYHEAIAPFMHQGKYPGSPLLAAALLRHHDHLHLYEMHSTDFRQLGENTAQDKRISIEDSNGYAGINSQLPAVQKRAIVLIDPSYELKEDYLQTVRAVVESYRRMPAAQVLLWYPVVERYYCDRMISTLMRTEVRDLWRYELGMSADTEGYGMTACGMLVLNPPWTLAAALRECLPLIQQQLAPEKGYWLVENLIAE